MADLTKRLTYLDLTGFYIKTDFIYGYGKIKLLF